MASPNTAGQKKRKSSDSPTIVPPTPVRPRMMDSTPPAESSSSGRKSSDGPTIALPTPVQSPFAELTMDSTPPAESSSGRNHPPFHVFINHCGQDTKHTLADSIYQELNATGLRVFLDKDELVRGDFFPQVLENAIANASLHIAIFSENYVKSSWCLAELEFMLRTGAKCIPIFYHVEPSNLRWGFKEGGIYANDFYKHENKNRYSTETLKSWKSALNKASYYIGGIINNECDEKKVVMNVVNDVLKELKTMRLDVAQHPVGLNEAEQDFQNIELQFKGPIKIIGIWGMGGIGKTTLAKYVYNKKSSLFQQSSFLFDVREAASKGLLHEKQKMLLKALKANFFENIDHIDQGKVILKNRLESVSLLMVLDDVDHKDQLDALMPVRDTLGDGSLIIITTRDKDVLKAFDISTIYEMRPLNPSNANELFCWHAFGQPSPIIDFKELAKNFIDACSGSPLSLKVLGGLLYGESKKEYWRSQLKKLSSVPKDIKSRLKISYDALEKEEKEMFLDVACFFIGWPSSSAIAIWDGSECNGTEWSGVVGWQRLVNKCLVELDADNNIRMHDHLRDLGREIANQQSPYRLWSNRQKIESPPQQEAIQIRGMADAFGDNCSLRDGNIILKTRQGRHKLPLDSLGLTIFIGKGDFINEECTELSRELLCFRCDSFAHKNLPSWLPLKELRVLELLKLQQLEELWDEDAPSQLRHLVIGHCNELKKIESLEGLTSLQTLRIYGCSKLKTVPSLAGLASLEEIKLSDCTKLEKIESLEGLTSLHRLTIKRCSELKTVPSLEGLTSLQTLTIKCCSELKTVPSLAGLASLKEIELAFCYKLKKIESLEGLTSLETLRIYGYSELKTLPSLAGLASLKKIELIGCGQLEKIESLEGLTSLETLGINGCSEWKTLPSLAGLTSLKKFVLEGCEQLDTLPSFAGLICLEEFRLRGCQKVDKVEGLEVLTSLKELEVQMCSMRPCMLKLPEQRERLKSVVVVANRLGVVETSILDTQKWPREEIICTRARAGIDVRNFFTSSLLEDVVQTYSSEYLHGLGGWGELRLRMPESAANGNAILICFIIHSILPDPSFKISTERGILPQESIWLWMGILPQESIWLWMGILPQESIWLWMGILPQESIWLHSERYKIEAWRDEVEVITEAWLLRGTEQSIRGAFHHLSQRYE